ncbi:MAG: hypothetical protein AMJ62_12860 [Myxococcales bacterium SG8_38]|nr:MAG: hypothetical protein AMJ62_12860 [Myxococcales bacterium SG8_38]
MRTRWTWCALGLWLLGCQSGEVPVRGANQGVEPSATYQPSPRDARQRVDAPIPAPSEPPVIIGQRQEEPKRDLSSELAAAVGIPSDCVRDFEASRPTTIRINVRAVVRPTGIIIEPSAYGTGLSEAARRCIEERVGLVVLDPLDEPVSQTVATTIEINYEPPVIVESDPGTPEPRLRDVVEPLPKLPDIPPSGTPIDAKEAIPIQEGLPTERPIEPPPSKKVTGPKPRPIDGYDVDENAQDWR